MVYQQAIHISELRACPTTRSLLFDSKWFLLNICTALARVLREEQGRTRGGDICCFNEGLRGCVRAGMGEGIVAIQGSEALYVSKKPKRLTFA